MELILMAAIASLVAVFGSLWFFSRESQKKEH